MDPKPKIVVTWPIHPDALEKLQSHYDVVVNEEEKALNGEELKAFVQGATAILCLLTNKITADIMDAAGSQLKIVATMSVGYDHIDLAAAAQKNIVVTNTPGIVDSAVAEHTIALMLGVAKALPQADSFIRLGQYKGWDPKLFVGPELGGKVLGIVGLGHIGSHVAKIAGYGLGMAIAYNDIKPNPEFESKFNAQYYELDDLLTIADVVTLHVPLVPATKHLINTDRLKKMKKSAILVNTSRGPVVDEVALIDALKNNTIYGAGIDVFENEPNIPADLYGLKNVVMTPHTASATVEARQSMAVKAVENIIAQISGSGAQDTVKTSL